jgi:hypothetical protein
MYKQPKVKEYLDQHHTKLWSRSMFGELSNVDYVCNSLAEIFSPKIPYLKSLLMVLLLDAIRQYVMVKIDFRKRICSRKFVGHKLVSKVISLMSKRSNKIRAINMSMIRCFNTLADIYATYKLLTEMRYHVDIANTTCSCMKWQITGLQCLHALFFISKLRGEGAEIENLFMSV